MAAPAAAPDYTNMIFMAKVAEQAGDYEGMLTFLRPLLEKSEELSVDERNMFSVAYKGLAGWKRTAWRAVAAVEENPKYSLYHDRLVSYKAKIEADLKKICKDVVGTVDAVFFQKATSAEARAFFLKMKADYFRYMSEVCVAMELEEVNKAAMTAYEAARKVSEELPSAHAVRLGVALNFSVFHYEHRKDIKEAMKVAKTAYDEGTKAVANMSDGKHDDAAEIMQLLKENLVQWSAEASEGEKPAEEKKQSQPQPTMPQQKA